MKREVHILMLEDDRTDAELTRFNLKQSGFSFILKRVDTREQFIRELDESPPELILSDYSLPGFNGNEALAIAQEKCPEIPFIFVTGTMGEEVAIETLRNGATDYVLKTRLSRLAPAVTRALRESNERSARKRSEAQLRASHKQLRALSVYLQKVREEERTRIAREVHDELGQALTGCKLDLAWIAGKLPRAQQVLIDKVRALSSHIDSTIKTVQRISAELRPGVLDHLGLAAALEWQANEFQNRTGIRCDVNVQIDESVLDQDTATTLFRIFQETLTNVIRHAGATKVTVDLKQNAMGVILDVIDNGRGISRQEMMGTTSMGLLGMRERAALLGGQFRIGKGPHSKGTRVKVQIPFRRPDVPKNQDHLQSEYEDPSG